MFFRGTSKNKHSDLQLPIRFAFGVSVALAGFFVYLLPIPPTKIIGKRMMQFGGGLAVEGFFNHVEKQKA